MAKSPPPEPTFGALDYITDLSERVALAGLLASDPTLADAQLSAEEWRARLDQYLSSPRP